MEKFIDRESFLMAEYETLREEIAVAKKNMFQLIIGGAAVIPAAQSLATTFSIDTITLALPMIVVVLVLLFLAENHAMMRAGTYILEQIEPSVKGVGGWETWLNDSKNHVNTRSVDKMLIIAFSILSSCYFLVSFVMAWRHSFLIFGLHGQYLIGFSYVFVGVILSYFLYSRAKVNTYSHSKILTGNAVE